MLIFISALSAIPAQAGDISYYYCRHSQGPKFKDFALTITGTTITLQPHDSPESPGTRIYRGKVVEVYSNGNVFVDFDSYSKLNFLGPYRNILFARDLFVKSSSGYARVYSGSPATDTLMYCEIKKIFYAQ